MFVPRVHHGFRFPHAAQAFLLTLLAILLAVAAWALLSISTTGEQPAASPAPASSLANVRSVAYLEPGPVVDRVMVRRATAGAKATELARFPSAFNLHARGSASPTGETLAAVSFAYGDRPRLTLLDVSTGARTVVEGTFDHGTEFAWTGDGSRLAAVDSSPPDETGRRSVTLTEVVVPTGEVHEVTTFEKAFKVAPVGYSTDGERLFVVVIDQSGSTLWRITDGETAAAIGSLSSGRTMDWSLSDDGSRVAYIEVKGGENRAYVGKTILTANGRVSELAAPDNQFGVAWEAGSPMPRFGGPGGSVQIQGVDPAEAYVVPFAWAPQGSILAATVVAAGEGEDVGEETLQLLTPEGRILLSEAPDAALFGWVVDVQ